jgi:hypothetical protein
VNAATPFPEEPGFLYNDFGGRKPQDCPIHAVSCSWVRTMLNVRSGPLSVKKLALPALVWLKAAAQAA